MVDKIEDKIQEETKLGFKEITNELKELNEKQDKNIGETIYSSQLNNKRNQMMAEAAGVSMEEAARRNAHNDEIASLTKQIEEKTEIAGKDSKEVQKLEGIKDKKEKNERKRQFLENNLNFKNIGEGLLKISENIGSKVEAGGMMLLKGIGVIALFAFLQSDTFKDIVGGIVDFVTDFIGLFTGEVDTLDFIKNHFGKILITLALFSGKIIALAKFIVGIPAILSSIAAGFAAVKLFFVSTLLPAVTAMLAPLAPLLIPIAAIAAGFFVLTKMITSFRDNFDKANEEFGFFGGILAGFTGGIKMILSDVAGVIDSILGFFGFPDLMDPIIKAIDEFDVMNFVGGVMDFFADIGNFITEGLASIGRIFKAIGAGAMAALTSPFSPIESFNKAFAEAMSGADVKPDLGNIAAAGAQMSGGEDDPARFIARKENEDMMMRRKEEMMGDKRAVMITNNNVVNKGGDSMTEVRGGDIFVQDQSRDPYTSMA